MFAHIGSALRSLGITLLVTLGAVLSIELIGWIISPRRYQLPPAVTVDAWINSDALAPADSAWMTAFVDEFCRSYAADWHSYVYFRRRPFTGHLINVDSAGLRHTTQYALRNPSRRAPLRVMLFGGSTMWGTGARDSATIPSQLSRIIAADTAAGPVEVWNFGESGFVSTQAVLRLMLELRRGNLPDYVIFYDGVNDVFAAYQNGEAGLPQNESHRAAEFNLLKEGGRRWKITLDSIYARTVTASLVRSLRADLFGPPPPPASRVELAPDIVRLYRGNLQLIEALARQYGFAYTAYWQPVVFERSAPSPYEKAQADLWGYARPLFAETYRLVREDSALRATKAFYEISSLFDEIRHPVFLDFCHISEAGNAAVARRMYEEMKRRGIP
jgi:lysophospholipase L1-like esterase